MKDIEEKLKAAGPLPIAGMIFLAEHLTHAEHLHALLIESTKNIYNWNETTKNLFSKIERFLNSPQAECAKYGPEMLEIKRRTIATLDKENPNAALFLISLRKPHLLFPEDRPTMMAIIRCFMKSINLPAEFYEWILNGLLEFRCEMDAINKVRRFQIEGGAR